MKFTHIINGNIVNEYNDIENIEEKNSKKYKFFLDNIQNNIYITDRLVFIRQNDEYIFQIEIGNKSVSSYKLKKENLDFPIQVKDSSYQVEGNVIRFNYELDTEDCEKHEIVLEIEE